jgi:hypothetical protein
MIFIIILAQLQMNRKKFDYETENHANRKFAVPVFKTFAH